MRAESRKRRVGVSVWQGLQNLRGVQRDVHRPGQQGRPGKREVPTLVRRRRLRLRQLHLFRDFSEYEGVREVRRQAKSNQICAKLKLVDKPVLKKLHKCGDTRPPDLVA